MTARPKTGIRSIEDVDGGRIVWLYGETDLDEVMLELARTHDEQWIATSTKLREGAEWPNPQSETALADARARGDYMAVWSREYDAAHIATIDEDHPTDLGESSTRDADVGWYRRLPWCHCGEGHGWHLEPSKPGRGASLAVVISTGGW